MGIETTDNIDNVIIPQRFIPFDIGTKITERYLVEINSYIDKKGFNYLEIPGLMRTISQDILLKIRINISIKLYIFSYGIGVFVLDDDFHPMNEKYAVDYCEYRKKSTQSYIRFYAWRGFYSIKRDNKRFTFDCNKREKYKAFCK